MNDLNLTLSEWKYVNIKESYQTCLTDEASLDWEMCQWKIKVPGVHYTLLKL